MTHPWPENPSPYGERFWDEGAAKGHPHPIPNFQKLTMDILETQGCCPKLGGWPYILGMPWTPPGWIGIPQWDRLHMRFKKHIFLLLNSSFLILKWVPPSKFSLLLLCLLLFGSYILLFGVLWLVFGNIMLRIMELTFLLHAQNYIVDCLQGVGKV